MPVTTNCAFKESSLLFLIIIIVASETKNIISHSHHRSDIICIFTSFDLEFAQKEPLFQQERSIRRKLLFFERRSS